MDRVLDDVLPDEFSDPSCFERDGCLESLLRAAPRGCLYCRLDELADED
jgi:hypothetical protein